MEQIEIKCMGCKKVHKVERTSELKENIIALGCNWCPDCQDSAKEEYKEWYIFKRKLFKKKVSKQEPKLF